MINYKFSKKNDKLFYEELTSNVNAFNIKQTVYNLNQSKGILENLDDL